MVLDFVNAETKIALYGHLHKSVKGFIIVRKIRILTPDNNVICNAYGIKNTAIYGTKFSLESISRYGNAKRECNKAIASKRGVKSGQVGWLFILWYLPISLFKVNDCKACSFCQFVVDITRCVVIERFPEHCFFEWSRVHTYLHFLLFVIWFKSDITWGPCCCLTERDNHTGIFHVGELTLKLLWLVDWYLSAWFMPRWNSGVQLDMVRLPWECPKALKDITVFLLDLL